MVLIYAGIGSRSTPADVLTDMESIGHQLANVWTLRSGFAEEADKAFFKGAKAANGKMEIYLPWKGFNWVMDTSPKFIVPPMTDILLNFAAQYHPNWDALNTGDQCLIARNGCQVMGQDLNTPADMVVCWTPNGTGDDDISQALRIAAAYNIPVFDLAIDANKQKLVDFVNQKEQ